MAAGRIVLPPFFPARDRNGRLVSGAKLYVYVNETTTKATIYADLGLSSQQANPVTANSSGQFPSIYAEAGTTDTPTLYTLAVTGNDGENIGNPSVLDNWQPSLDADTASSALSEAAAVSAAADAAAAAAALEDMLAVQATGDDAAAIAARAAKSANGSDFADKEEVTRNLLFQHASAGAIAATLHDKINIDMPLDIALDFGAVGDGVADDTPAFQAAMEATLGKRPVFVPTVRPDGTQYEFALKTKLVVAPVPLRDNDPQPVAYPGSFAPGLWLMGDGMASAIIRPMVPNDCAIDLDVTNPDPYAYRAQMGIRVENLAFIGDNSVPGASVFKMRNAYQLQYRQLHIRNMTGDGIIGVNGDFADDGWNMVDFSGLWIEACQGFGINMTGSAGRNEGSFTRMQHVFIQGCGLNEYFRITNISNDNPAVVTVSMLQVPARSPQMTGHGFVEGDLIKPFGVKNTITLGNNPITTTSGSKVVRIASTAHGRQQGDVVTIAGATAVGGITLSGAYYVATVATNTFDVVHATAASSGATGGGAAVTVLGYNTAVNAVRFKVGPNPTATTFTLYTDAASPVAVSGAGFGTHYSPLSAVTINNNPFATVDQSTTVTVTDTAHGCASTDTVTFSGAAAVGGITISGEYRMTVIDADTYTITHSSAATSTVAAGGGAAVSATYYKQLGVCVPEVSYWEPRSGGMSWKGQLLHMDQCAFTVNQNCQLFVKGQSGLGIGVLLHNVTWENGYRRHIMCTGVTNWRQEGCQFHGNQSYKQWIGQDFDGADYAIRGVYIANHKVRARLGEGTAFRVAGTNAETNTCHIDPQTLIWDDFDYPEQRRFEGWQFPTIPMDCVLRDAGATAKTLGPRAEGSTGTRMPLRRRGPNNSVPGGVASWTGEFTPWAASATLSKSSNDDEGNALAVNTYYYVYYYDDDGDDKLVASTIAPVRDTASGYPLKPTDPTKLFVGSVKTEVASTDFITTDTQFLEPMAWSASNQGVIDHVWQYNDVIYMKSGTRPTSPTGGTKAWPGRLIATQTYDPPSLAAGAAASPLTITVTGITTADELRQITHATPGILFKDAYISATNTVIATPYNATTGTLDAASGLVTVRWSRAA